MYEHKNKLADGFTKRKNCNLLVWFNETDDVSVAIEIEKKMKKWNRAWKIRLILQRNPEWIDLSADWF